MKKIIPYILAAVLIGALIALFVSGNSKSNRQIDQRVTLNRKDKIPYGTWVAFNNLNSVFPKAKIQISRKEPGYWDSINIYDNKQAYVVLTDRFVPDEIEMKKMIAFAQAGNDVFISARYVSSAADNALRCASNSFEFSLASSDSQSGEVKISLNSPPFTAPVQYKYPGGSFYSYFTQVDSTISQILGTDESGRPNFIRLRTGSGSFYLHLEPLAFSNYFLLHENNIAYFENAFSVIKPDIKQVIWDEYYLFKKGGNAKKKGWMSVLMNMKNAAGDHPFKAAFWLLIALLFLYVLMEMRRRQRMIPVVRKPKNDSLDFVKTIGRLYFDKSDHRNLCRKMAAYFLEHIRSKYKLATGLLNEDFILTLHYKSGIPEQEISDIIVFIRHLEKAEDVTSKQLESFHKQLESFYKKA